MDANSETPRIQTGLGLDNLCEESTKSLSPNEEFELAYHLFQTGKCGGDIEEFGENAYEEYREIEDFYERCNPPTKINTKRMTSLREDMQRYAEANR